MNTKVGLHHHHQPTQPKLLGQFQKKIRVQPNLTLTNRFVQQQKWGKRPPQEKTYFSQVEL